mgnify:FL=1|jgi:UDP-2,4-diacetamido-2,4,6-trideoxy-beta-L-altropyranose hydrolase
MIYIRADMNEQIATGHIMRCLSIADALRGLGEPVRFILADEQAVSLLKQRGYDAIVLHTQWNCMEEELSVLSQVIRNEHIDKLLIDSYQVTQRYLAELSKLVTTFYIDDLNLFEYPVDAVICYANYWKKFQYKINDKRTTYLLGMKYVPLKQAFWNCEAKIISEKADNLLILTGGSDPFNVTEQILDSIDTYQFQTIDVICGIYNTNYNKFVKKYENNKNIKFHQAVNNIEQYMKNADIAISAGGTTLYELCAIGTPAISFSFADNQLDNVRQFQEDGLIDYAGDARMDDIAGTSNQYLTRYRNDFELRKEKSEKMQKMVDGKGAERIARAIVTL